MAQFPELPSGDNPYVAAAARGSSDAAQMMQSLQSSLQQHAKLQQQQQQQATEEEKEYYALIAKGDAVPYEPYSQQKDDSGLVRRTPNPPPGQGAVRTLPYSGRTLYYPTQEEKAAKKYTAEQKFKDDIELKKNGATQVYGTHEDADSGRPTLMTPQGADPSQPDDPSHLIQTPNGDSYHFPTPDEKAQGSLKNRLDAEAQINAAKPGTKRVDTEHFSQPVMIDEKTGEATPIKLPDGVTHNAAKPTKQYTFERQTDDNGRVTMIRQAPDGTAEVLGKQGWQPFDAANNYGPKRKDPDAQPGHKPPSAAEIRKVTDTRANTNTAARVAMGKALKELGNKPSAEEYQGIQDDYVKSLQEAEDKYGQDMAGMGINVPRADYTQKARDEGWGKSTAQPTGGAPQATPAQSNAQPAPQPQQQPVQPSAQGTPKPQQAPKTGSLQQLRAYAKQAGISEAEALKRAKAEGIQIR